MTTSIQTIKQLIQKMKGEFEAANLSGLDDNRKKFNQTGSETPLPDSISINSIEIISHKNHPIPAEWVIPEKTKYKESHPEKIILFCHGGGYSIGSPASHRPLCARIADKSKCRVLSIDYRLAPEHAYPAALEDALDSYHFLLTEYPNAQIFFVGDSAGGGLVMAILLAIKENYPQHEMDLPALPMPAGAIGISAWLDLECTSDSYQQNKDIDLLASAEGLRFVGRAYAKKQFNKNPLVSPFYSDDLSGLCPVLIQVGDAETLLDENISFAKQALKDGVKVDLEVWPNMVHVWHSLYGLIPEAEQAIEALAKWINQPSP